MSQLLSTQSLKNTVQANGNKLHLCFAADGRRTSNKIGTVMAVFSILDEQQHDCITTSTLSLCIMHGEILEQSCIFILRKAISERGGESSIL